MVSNINWYLYSCLKKTEPVIDLSFFNDSDIFWKPTKWSIGQVPHYKEKDE